MIFNYGSYTGAVYKTINLLTFKLFNRNNLSVNSKVTCTMNAINRLKCLVRFTESDENIFISFKYSSQYINERQFNLKRKKDEEIAKVFARIMQNINTFMAKKIDKKKKDKNWITEVPQIEVSLEADGVTIETDTLNCDAWKNGSVLKVGECQYNVYVNAPIIKSLKLPKSLMSGYTVYPIIDMEFGTPKDSTFTWFKERFPHEKKRNRRKSQNTESGDSDCDSIAETDKEVTGYGGWYKISEGMSYTTNSSEIGRKLKVKCIPINDSLIGFESEAVSQSPVEAGPGHCPFEERHCFTKEDAPMGSFRIISYNILADLYADSDYSRTVLYPYCPPYALEIDYRKQLIVKEIIGYNGDIYCLQEVDTKIYNSDLRPIMLTHNYESVMTEKAGQVVEGLGCFFRQSKFQLLHDMSVVLSELLVNDTIFSEILTIIKSNEKLYERFMKRKSVLQCLVLKCLENPNRLILCANTHLYYHPDSDHIRLLQASLCVKYVEKVIAKLNKKMPHMTIAPIICGDFNSCPEFGVYQLYTTGFVSNDSPDFKSNSDESISGLSLSHSLSLGSGCGTPQYTNYTPAFNGCLDYIYYDTNNLCVTDVVPFPSHEQVTQYIAMPNIVFPSDHLSLVCTLSWVNK